MEINVRKWKKVFEKGGKFVKNEEHTPNNGENSPKIERIFQKGKNVLQK